MQATAIQAVAVTVLLVVMPAILWFEWLIRKVDRAIAEGRLRNTTHDAAQTQVATWKSMRMPLTISAALAIVALAVFH